MKTLRSRAIRLAHKRPDLRPHLLPLLKLASVPGWVEVPVGTNLDLVWEMYARTYAKIGLSKGSKSEMLEYDIWEIFPDDSGQPIAFVLSKSTSLGKKLGLAGSDGSSGGKSALIRYLGLAFQRPGNYAEVSHAVEATAMRANPPVVCAVRVPEILKKPVTPMEDGIHYRRNLSGVGAVEKVMIGRPRGIETTEASNPSCPISAIPTHFASEEGDDNLGDLEAHLSCLIDL